MALLRRSHSCHGPHDGGAGLHGGDRQDEEEQVQGEHRTRPPQGCAGVNHRYPPPVPGKRKYLGEENPYPQKHPCPQKHYFQKIVLKNIIHSAQKHILK